MYTGIAVLAITAAVVIPAKQRTLLHSHGRLHPWFHLMIFCGLGVLAARTMPAGRMQVLTLATIALFGCMTEYAEHWEYGTPLEVSDILLDAVGGVLGTGLGCLVQLRAAHTDRGAEWE